MKKLQYYVEDCPKCGSLKTGRFIHKSLGLQSPKDRVLDELRTKQKALRRGEFIRIRYNPRDGQETTTFCEECGVEWFGEISKRWLSKEELLLDLKEKDIKVESFKNIKGQLPKEEKKYKKYKKVKI